MYITVDFSFDPHQKADHLLLTKFREFADVNSDPDLELRNRQDGILLENVDVGEAERSDYLQLIKDNMQAQYKRGTEEKENRESSAMTIQEFLQEPHFDEDMATIEQDSDIPDIEELFKEHPTLQQKEYFNTVSDLSRCAYFAGRLGFKMDFKQ
jgi:hypothetical protein